MGNDLETDAHYGFLQRFTPGMNAKFNGRDVVISHVQISRSNLMVYFQGQSEPVPSEKVQITLTELTGPGFRKRLRKLIT